MSEPQHHEGADKSSNQSHLEREASAEDVESQHEKGGAAAATPAVADFSHGFWDHELAHMRKEYLIGILRVTIAVSVLIWAVVTIYWGSLWKANDLVYKLNAIVVNRDPGAIGTNLTNAFLADNNMNGAHLTWSTVPASQYPDMASIERAVAVDEVAWAMVEIMQDATAQLDNARTNALASWDPTSVVKVYYSEARNQQSVNGAVVGNVRGVLMQALAQINTQSVAQWLAANSANAAALTALATTAPQTLAMPVASSFLNLRPWTASVSIAPTFVGLIYAMILAFNVTMANFAMRQGIQRKLRLRSLIMMRLFVPLLTYVFLSCMFSMINIPFKLPFGGMGLTGDPYGAGFIIWWCFTFLGMAVLGLCTEAFLSLVGPPFIGFALVFFIIINVSVANLPIEQQVSLFKYGYAMPFYNLKQAYVAIIYNTGRQVLLLKYMGILLAWLALLFLTLPIWVWKEQRQMRKAPAGGPPAH